MEAKIRGREVVGMQRRGKYILVNLERGGLLMHLGMSGSFSTPTRAIAADRHDHYDLITEQNRVVRYRDPRRFGCLLWTPGAPLEHARIRALGPEPLGADFTGDYLHAIAKRRRVAVKTLLMDSRVVVGVGNIYAAEALHAAAIHPSRPCHRIAAARYRRLSEAVREILSAAIQQGGSTIRDFSGSDGTPGYFAQRLLVYGREGDLCENCGAVIRNITIGQRSTFYCPKCQR